jgi:hypothetical protein
MRRGYDPSDNSFVVKSRGSARQALAVGDLLCRSFGLERSPDFFESMALAAKEDKNALGRLLAVRPILRAGGPGKISQVMGATFVGLQITSPRLLLCKQRAQAREKLCFAERFLKDGRGLHRQERKRLG